MKFFSFASVALAAFTGLVAAMDSTTVINNIKDLTALSDTTNQMVLGITIINFALQAPVCALCGIMSLSANARTASWAEHDQDCQPRHQGRAEHAGKCDLMYHWCSMC
jgi:hypothetical protein